MTCKAKLFNPLLHEPPPRRQVLSNVMKTNQISQKSALKPLKHLKRAQSCSQHFRENYKQDKVSICHRYNSNDGVEVHVFF